MRVVEEIGNRKQWNKITKETRYTGDLNYLTKNNAVMKQSLCE
jgi:hypothetical protein